VNAGALYAEFQQITLYTFNGVKLMSSRQNESLGNRINYN